MINFARFIHRRMDGVFPHGASKYRSAVRCTEAEAEQARNFLQVSGPGYTCDHLPYLDNLPVMMIANLALGHQFSLPSNNANYSVTRCDIIDYILIPPGAASTEQSLSADTIRFPNSITSSTIREHHPSHEMFYSKIIACQHCTPRKKQYYLASNTTR